MKISTRNLIISKFKRNNVNSKYISWMNDIDIIKYLGREDYFNGFKKADGIEYYERMLKDDKVIFFAIHHKNGKFIGTCKVILIDNTPKNKISEIGIMIGDKSYWGMGLAKETITELSRYLFDNSNKKIIAGGFLCNVSMVKDLNHLDLKKRVF